MTRGRRGTAIAIAVAVVIVIALVACTINTRLNEAKQEPRPTSIAPLGAEDNGGKIKIGFANMTDNLDFAQKVKRSIEREAAKYGVELLLADNRFDGATALQNAEGFIKEQVDLVIEFQVDERYGNIIMDRLRLAQIPVIAVDIPMPGATFFGADNYRAGHMAGVALGHVILDEWQGKLDRLFILELPEAGPIPAARIQGQRDGLESVIGPVSEDIVLHLNGRGSYEESKRIVAAELKKIPADTKVALLNMNDDTALGGLEAVKQEGRTGNSLIVGQNAMETFLQELEKENTALVGSTAYFPEKYGEKLIPAAIKLIQGEAVPPYLFTEHVFIGWNNVSQYAPQ